MEVKLVVVGGDAKAAEIDLKLPTIIGRGREASLTLPHPLVSRQHCELFESGGQLMARDLGSLNGTFINNERIDGDAVLSPGELLTIGTVTFRAAYELDPHALPPEDVDPSATVQVNPPASAGFAESTAPADDVADSSDLTEPVASAEGEVAFADDDLDDDDFAEFDNLEFEGLGEVETDESDEDVPSEEESVGEVVDEVAGASIESEAEAKPDPVGAVDGDPADMLSEAVASPENPQPSTPQPSTPQSLPTPGQALPMPTPPGAAQAPSATPATPVPQAITPPAAAPQASPIVPPNFGEAESDDKDDDALNDFLKGLE